MDTLEKEIERYLSNEMTDTERITFEKKIQEDKELYDTVVLYKEMNIIYDSSDWNVTDSNKNISKLNDYESFLRGEKGQLIKERIANAEAQYLESKNTPKQNSLKKVILYGVSIAAVFILVLFSVGDFNSEIRGVELYEEYKDFGALPSLTLRDSITLVAKAELLFRSENYNDALQVLDTLMLDHNYSDNPQLLVYKGLSELETNRVEKSILTFTKLLNGNTLDANKANWYLALCFLKKEDLKAAQKNLKKMASDNLNFKDDIAKEILEKVQN